MLNPFKDFTMPQIDRAGTFIGTILESGFSTTANGYPQWVIKLGATKYYAKSPEELAHFQIAEPAYVDWSSFGEEIVGYLVLFNDKGPLMSYEQAQAATGWDGQDFQTLGDHVGKSILFRVEEDTYNNVTKLKVNWIDAENAPPERSLKQVDAGVLKDLNNKFLSGIKKPVAPAKPTSAAKPAVAGAPGKPITKPGAPAVQPPAQPSASTPASAPAPTTPATTPAAKVETPKVKTPPAKKTTPPPAPPPAAVAAASDLPTSCTKLEAWDYVSSPAVKGSNEDTVIEEAWIAATAEVGETVNEEDFTPEMWAKVRDTVVKDLK